MQTTKSTAYVEELIKAADQEMRRGGVEPASPLSAREVLVAWQRASGAEFARLALLAYQKRPPLPHERKAFLARLNERIPAVLRAS